MYKVLLLLPLAGCLGGDVSVTPVKTDDDNDGYNIEVDCDDAHATVNPDAEEVCDGLDNDCNQAVDDAPADGSSFFADTDGDGFGDPATATVACAAAAGYVADNTDCNDQSSSMAPGLDEICDGLDNDCNGAVDDSPIDQVTIYVDTDGDGYGDDGTATLACELGSGEVDQGGDCDDGDSAIHPGASETDCTDPTDYNCDGSSAYADADGDGSPACSDCNDQDAAVHPAASEVCNDLDDDCDGWIDDDDDSLTGASTWYRDPDGDGYASGAGSTLTQCDLPSGYAAVTGDCDDYDATVSPAAMEVCDGADVDEDCDGLSDDSDPNVHSGSWSTWYRDADGDGYGDSARSVLQCDAPSAYISQGGDCDDAAAAVNPGATEVCNTLDDDCDLLTDDQDPGVSGLSTWYTDGDGDGYGDTASRACTRPSGSVATGGDCDDNDSSVSPGATERCDSTNTDEDCNGLADDDDSAATGKSSWYRDNDGDAYGGSTSILACDASSGYIRSNGDCDDSNASISPGAVEVCDSADVDEDCDGVADDGDSGASGKTTIYADSDGDGYGSGSGIVRCNLLSGYVSNALDCNDANSVINPGAVEICDSTNADEDCDGLADDNDSSAQGGSSWFRDADGDGHGAGSAVGACDAPSGYVSSATDCNDSRADVYTGATELCDSVDNNCDGSIDENLTQTWYRDADSDGYGNAGSSSTACGQPSGYVANSTDCNDNNAAISPGDPEVCDAANTDEDCDGLADNADSSATGTSTYYQDADQDGYGSTTSQVVCDAGSGYISTGGDCNDNNAAVSPGDVEVCADSTDNDCDGVVDNGCATRRWEGDYSTSNYDLKIYGTSTGDDFGTGLAAGDWNGDGLVDVAVGAPDEEYSTNTDYGAVFVYGGALPSGVETATTSDDAEIYSNSGADGAFGEQLWTIPDMNADGVDELMVSKTNQTYYYTISSFRGSVLTGLQNYTVDYYSSLACADLSGTGNFYSSGSATLACGYITSSTSGSFGAVRIYGDSSASTLISLDGEYTGDQAGRSLDLEHDFDGDGIHDALVGAPYANSAGADAGKVYVVLGPVTGNFLLSGADMSIIGQGVDSHLGMQVGGGDISGDGRDDFFMTVESYDYGSRTNAGGVFVFDAVGSGPTIFAAAGLEIYGDSANDYLGGACAPSLGDVDGDGNLDILVSTPYDTGGGSGAGGAWLIYGPATGGWDLSLNYDARWLGDGTDYQVGAQAKIVGDTDGDGTADIALTGPNADERGYSNYGAMWLFLGN